MFQEVEVLTLTSRSGSEPVLLLPSILSWPPSGLGIRYSRVPETLRVDPMGYLSCFPAAWVPGEMVGNSRSCDLGLCLGTDFCIEANGSQ